MTKVVKSLLDEIHDRIGVLEKELDRLREIQSKPDESLRETLHPQGPAFFTRKAA